MGDFFGFTKSVVSIGARVFHLVLRHVVGVGVERRQFDYFWDRWEVWLDPLLVWTAHGRSLQDVGTRWASSRWRDERDGSQGPGRTFAGAAFFRMRLIERLFGVYEPALLLAANSRRALS